MCEGPKSPGTSRELFAIGLQGKFGWEEATMGAGAIWCCETKNGPCLAASDDKVRNVNNQAKWTESSISG